MLYPLSYGGMVLCVSGSPVDDCISATDSLNYPRHPLTRPILIHDHCLYIKAKFLGKLGVLFNNEFLAREDFAPLI